MFLTGEHHTRALLSLPLYFLVSAISPAPGILYTLLCGFITFNICVHYVVGSRRKAAGGQEEITYHYSD